MPNFVSMLKSEISRVARKEVRTEIQALKKAASSHRSDIAALKRRAQALERELRRLGRTGPKATASQTGAAEVATPSRYSAKSLASQRRRLGLSASDCGLLVGASAQSIYNWEEGNVRPQPKHLAAIAALRSMGRRGVATRLEALKSAK